MEQVPQSMDAQCPDCREETQHKSLKGRFQGKNKLEMVLKCSECGRVHKEILEVVGQVNTRMIISRGDESRKVRADFPADWELAVGDEFMHGDEMLKVTGIEVGGRRVNKAEIDEVQTLWTMNYDTLSLKVSISRRGRTRAVELEVDPGEYFEVGQNMEIDDIPVEIHSIKLHTHSIRRGGAEARDIVRIYGTDKRPVKRRGRKPKHGSSW